MQGSFLRVCMLNYRMVTYENISVSKYDDL